jgi:hypothetical protein
MSRAGSADATVRAAPSTVMTLCYDAPSVAQALAPARPEAVVTLITSAVTHPIEFIVATVVAGLMVFVFLRAAMSAERRQVGWVRSVTGPNAKLLFGLLFVAWAVAFGIGLQLVPHTGANSPYGGLALIALFSGFFIMMGFLWSVIGE